MKVRTWAATALIGACLLAGRADAAQPITNSTPAIQKPPAGANRLPPCATEAPRASGTTYYVCDCGPGSAPGCVPGSDANPGTSKASPWKSWAKGSTQFATMAGGATVAFCRGGAWAGLSGTGAMRNTKCAASSTCDMRDYDPRPVWGRGGEEKPILQFAPGQKVLELGWYQKWDRTPIRGVRLLNLDLVGSRDGSVAGVHVWGKVEDLEVCNTTFRNGFDAAYTGVVTSTIQRVNFHHNQIVNNPFGIGPIQGTSCAADCVFDSNYMDLNGGASNRDHSIYVGSSPDPKGTFPDQRCASSGCYITAQRIRITNNEIRRSARGAGGTCVGSALVVHEPHDGLVIENNLIYEPPGTASEGCFGIDVSSGNDAPGAFRGTVIARNRIFNVGGVGIRVSECPDCIIENNLVVAGQTTGVGIKYPDERSQPPPDSLESSRGLVRNNTVYVPPGSRSMNAGIRVGTLGEGTGYVVANNALVGPRALLDVGAGVTVEVGNRTSTSAKWFKNPSPEPGLADFSAEDGAPLVDAGNATYASPSSIGSVLWSPAERAPARAAGAGPDIGAFER
jgi:hypothetical protein